MVTGQDLTAFLLLAVSGADLDELRLRGDPLGKMSSDLGLIAVRVGALCGIRATGKCFPLARRRSAPGMRRTVGHSRY
ncbi:MAG: hypothetical protein SA176_17485, partial [Edaphobacter sp.]|uniref:hypothetical protein n=1 Tax=Edaphobacter sp. TaxID=1934404 RepID=UPI0029812274